MKRLVACVVPAVVVGITLRGQQDPDAFDDARATGALQRVAAVEEIRASRVLCRIRPDGDFDSVTVRLHGDNSRSIAFNGDVSGYETKVRCLGGPDPQCTAVAAQREASSADACPPCPCAGIVGEPAGPYSRQVASKLNAMCSRDGSTRILLLGLGCGELASHVAHHCGTTTEIEAVELDPRLPTLARTYFGMPDSVRVTVGDALPFVLAKRDASGGGDRYDVVFVDCFSVGGQTPEHCRSAEFLRAVHALVRAGGEVIQHLWHKDDAHASVAEEFKNTVALYRSEFNCDGCRVSEKSVGVDSVVVAALPSTAGAS